MLTPRQLSQEELDQAICGMERLERVTIELVPGGFLWKLHGDGREVLAGFSGPEQLADMLQVTEVLINTEFGIAGERLCQPALN